MIGSGFYGDWRVTPGGVEYDDGHLSDRWKKPPLKSYRRLLAQGISQQTADSFLSIAQQMRGMDADFRDTEDRLWFARAIDSAVAEVTTKYESCGPSYAVAARRVHLQIVIRDTIWQVATPIYSGWVRGESSLLNYRNHLYSVQAVCLYVSATDEIAEARSVLAWEIGNTYARDLGYVPASLEQEAGNRRPCEVFSAH